MDGLNNPVEAGLQRQPGSMRWQICLLLFAATSINYMDRQVIAILKPTLMQSIGMTELGYGRIMASFMAAYALGLLLAGRFVDRVGTRVGYMVIMALWSLSAMGHALARTVAEFAAARFSLGLGESGNFPAAIKTVSEWFPQQERALATGIFNSGANLGAILAPLIVPWVTLRYGWHAAFLVTGGFSALWIFWWFRHYRKPEIDFTLSEISAQNLPLQPIVWGRLFLVRQTWGYSIAKFLTDPVWWFFLFYLPSFFSQKFHLDLSHLGLPLIVVYSASTLGSIGGGWLSSPFRKLGITLASARLLAMLVCALLVMPILFLDFVQSEWLSIALLSLAAAAHQGWSANLYTTASDMYSQRAVGSVTGIGGMAGAVGGVLLMNYAGYILHYTGSYTTLFLIAGSVYLLAFLILNLLAPGLRRVEVIG